MSGHWRVKLQGTEAMACVCVSAFRSSALRREKYDLQEEFLWDAFTVQGLKGTVTYLSGGGSEEETGFQGLK